MHKLCRVGGYISETTKKPGRHCDRASWEHQPRCVRRDRSYLKDGLGVAETTLDSERAPNESTTATSYQYTTVSRSEVCV